MYGKFVWSRNFKHIQYFDTTNSDHKTTALSIRQIARWQNLKHKYNFRWAEGPKHQERGGCFKVAFYIFQISAVGLGKWSLSRFKGNTSGIQQTGEMILRILCEKDSYKYACQYFTCCWCSCCKASPYLALGSN